MIYIVDGSTSSQRGDAYNAYKSLTSFEFILILYLIREIMGITYVLCQALQQQSQDIVNGWDKLLKNVTSICGKHDIEVPNFGASYVVRQERSHHQKDHITVESII